MTESRARAIENSLARGSTPAELYQAAERIILAKRSWRPSEKASALAAWTRDIEEVVARVAKRADEASRLAAEAGQRGIP